MPRVHVYSSRSLYEHLLHDVRRNVMETSRKVVSEQFGVEDVAVEVGWLIREESIGTASITLDVEWSVGLHGFPEETEHPEFTARVRDSLAEALAKILFPKGRAVYIDVWPRPQHKACWRRLIRTEWLAERE